MIGKKAFMGAKAFAKRHYSGAIKSMKELKAPAKKYGVKIEKHIKRNPKKYAVGATAVAGAGVYSQHQKHKKDGTHARLKKDLKRKGFIT